jgi:hypothetical protein
MGEGLDVPPPGGATSGGSGANEHFWRGLPAQKATAEKKGDGFTFPAGLAAAVALVVAGLAAVGSRETPSRVPSATSPK